MDLWTIVVSVLSPVAVGAAILFGLKAHLGSYLDQKGKNLATHEDIQKLVDQVRETERVKAEITDNIWDRQQRWTAKHALYRELLEAFNGIYSTSIDLAGGVEFSGNITEAKKTFLSSWRSFHSLKRVASITISQDAFEILDNMKIDPDAPQMIKDIVWEGLELFQNAARRDLGYPPFDSSAALH